MGPLNEAANIVKELLSKEGILSEWMRYLAAYRVIEGNLALFDKLARCRDFREFEMAIYEALRVKDRVKQKLRENVENQKIELYGLQPEHFDVGKEALKSIMELATRNPQAPRAVGALIASLGLAYGGIREVR
ncbi:MAG TPA: hypothetical protein ENF89_00420 [Candidatus Bathyarchaeota archaeon]|nr:hypothetical protein [Candidatus Bathyarchaeota archaeon]